MFLNSVLKASQKLLSGFYTRSFVLQKIDWLIYINILLVIVSSTVAQSDNIGIFAVFGIILTVIKLLTKPAEKFRLTKADMFLLVYFMIVLISVAGSSLLLYSFKGFCKTFIYLGFYVSFVHYIKDNKSKIKYILLALACAVMLESLYAFYQNFLSVSAISGWQDVSHLNPEEVMTRVYGSLKPYNPNLFGGYLLAALPSTLILVYLPLLNKHFKTSLCGLVCFFAASAAIILTGCRGAYLGLLAEFILLVVITYRFLKPFYKKVFTWIVSVFTTVIFFLIISTSALRARVFSIFAMRNDSSNSFRFNVYSSCIKMLKDNFLLGIGVGNQNFREIYGLYMKTGFDALSAYNIYLEIAVESGIFALIAFLCFLVCNITRCLNYIFTRRNASVIYLTVALVSISGILIHGIVDTVFFRPQIQFIFWIMIGIIRVITDRDGRVYLHD